MGEISVTNRVARWVWRAGLTVALIVVATGLARAGDRVGDQAYLDDESPWSFSFVLVVPIAPR